MAKAELVTPKVEEQVVLTLSKDEAWTLATALLNTVAHDGPYGYIIEDIHDSLDCMLTRNIPVFVDVEIQSLPDDFDPHGWAEFEDEED